MTTTHKFPPLAVAADTVTKTTISHVMRMPPTVRGHVSAEPENIAVELDFSDKV